MIQKKQIAVITGDIVGSSTLGEDQKKNFQEKILHWSDQGILLKPQFYRGDSFQLASALNTALKLTLKFRTQIKQLNEANDIRASIGIGEVSSWNDDVLLSNGSAFERSGKNLDQLKKRGLHIIIVTGNRELDIELETYCYMADSLLQNMTSTQAGAVFHRLDNIPQEKIAEIFKISQPAVSKTLKAANWKAIEKFLNRYEQIIKKNYGNSE